MPALHARLNELAAAFVSEVIAAVRTASVADLMGVRPERNGTPARTARTSRRAVRPTTAGRQRRSSADLDQAVAEVAALLRSRGTPMRSEEIQRVLQMDRRAMPLVLRRGVEGGALAFKGERRARVYSVPPSA